jgi:hypothetical protein
MNQTTYVADIDENGFITSLSIQDEQLIQTDKDKVDKYLKHVGVMGMRWGVRSQRNMPGESGGKKPKQENSEPVRLKRNMPGETGGKKPRNESADHKAAAAIKAKRLSEMSNDDIEKIAKRLQLEKRYKDLNPNKVAKGKKSVDSVFVGIGKVSAVTASIIALAAVGKPLLLKVFKAVKKT